MQLRRHEDIIAIKSGELSPPMAYHARNLQVAQISEEAWNSMAPSTFSNGFEMKLEPSEILQPEAYQSLIEWNKENDSQVSTRNYTSDVQSLTINVTQLCNLHCTYCAAGGDGTYGDPVAKISVEKTIPQIEYFLNKLSEGSSFHISFLGGEPLLYPEALRALALAAQSMAASRGIILALSVITNGTLINEKLIELMHDLNLAVTISLDGTPEQHDLARPQKNGRGSSEKAYAGLELLLKYRNIFNGIRIHGVFGKSNLKVLEAYQHYSQYKVDTIELTFDITETDTELNQIYLSEMSKVAAMAYTLGGEKQLRQIVLFDSYFNALDLQIRTENHCGSGKSLISLDARNKMYACPLDVGNKTHEIGENLSSLEENLVEKNNCQPCWARFLCGGGCLFAHRTSTGNKHKKHISYCERTRYLIGLALLYYEKSRG